MNKRIFSGFSKRKLTLSALTIFGTALIFAASFGLTMTAAQVTYTLTVTKIGGNMPTSIIASNPAGIDCGETCSAEYAPGETVTLTASSGSFSSFREWGGACTGSGTTCTVTMDEAKNVTARFDDTLAYEKCSIENPSTWGLRFRLTGSSVTLSGCRAKCLAAGGNGNFSINAVLGWCVCGTTRQPVSTQPPTQGCDVKCPGTNDSCGGNLGQYSTYRVAVAPTAASTSVAGRVVTADGRGVVSAFVSLTDSDGNRRIAITNPFGYYRFDEIGAGQIVLMRVSSKNYQFEPRIITTNDNLTDVDFVSKPLE